MLHFSADFSCFFNERTRIYIGITVINELCCNLLAHLLALTNLLQVQKNFKIFFYIFLFGSISYLEVRHNCTCCVLSFCTSNFQSTLQEVCNLCLHRNVVYLEHFHLKIIEIIYEITEMN